MSSSSADGAALPGGAAQGPGPPRPVFICGASRSGTELMRQILNGHPAVAIANETHYFEDLRPRLRAPADGPPTGADARLARAYFARLAAGAYGTEGTERPGRAAEPPPEGASVDAMFRAHCRAQAHEQGKDEAGLVFWGEKTPRHVFCAAEMAAAFPGAVFIFMLRDPRGAVASYRDWTNHFHDPEAVPPALARALAAERTRVRRSFSLVIAAVLWRLAFAAARRAAHRLGPARFRIQRFETLLDAPEREVAAICALLGIAPVPGMLDVLRLNSSYEPADAPGIARDAATAWRGRLSDRETWAIERLCRAPMAAAGYGAAAERAHPGFLAVEIVRLAWRVPLAFAANRRRMGSPLGWLRRRIAAAGAAARPR